MASEVIAELGRRAQDVEPKPREPSPMERTFAEIARGRFRPSSWNVLPTIKNKRHEDDDAGRISQERGV